MFLLSADSITSSSKGFAPGSHKEAQGFTPSAGGAPAAGNSSLSTRPSTSSFNQMSPSCLLLLRALSLLSSSLCFSSLIFLIRFLLGGDNNGITRSESLTCLAERPSTYSSACSVCVLVKVEDTIPDECFFQLLVSSRRLFGPLSRQRQ